jgi:hypothetical protein
VIGVTPRHNIRQVDQVIAVKQRADLSRGLDALTGSRQGDGRNFAAARALAIARFTGGQGARHQSV